MILQIGKTLDPDPCTIAWRIYRKGQLQLNTIDDTPKNLWNQLPIDQFLISLGISAQGIELQPLEYPYQSTLTPFLASWYLSWLELAWILSLSYFQILLSERSLYSQIWTSKFRQSTLGTLFSSIFLAGFAQDFWVPRLIWRECTTCVGNFHRHLPYFTITTNHYSKLVLPLHSKITTFAA